MAERHVRVTLSANVRAYSRSVNAAAADTEELRNAAERFSGKEYKARVTVETDVENAQRDFDAMLERFNSADSKFQLEVDTDSAQRRVGHLADQIKSRIGAAVRAIPEFDLDADATDTQTTIAMIRGELAALGKKKLDVDMDAAGFLAKIAELRAALRALSLSATDIRAKVDSSAAHAELAGLEAHVRKLAGAARLEIDTDRASRSVSAFTTMMDKRIRAAIAALPPIDIDANSTPADRAIRGIRARLVALSNKTIGVDISADDAMIALGSLEARLRDLQRSTRNVRLRADVGTALNEVRAFREDLDKIDGRQARARLSVSGGAGASRQVALIMNSIAALGPAAVTAGAAVTGALLAIGSTVGILGAALGTSILALNGVGDALEAMGKAEAAAGENAVESANKRRLADRAIEDSRRTVVRAEQDQAQAAAQGARDIEDARAAVVSATENAAQANVDAAEAVEDATEAEALAHQRVRYALEDLSEARQQAVRDMEDMRERSSDLALDERDAVVRLKEARNDLAEAEGTSATTALDLEKARIAVARAEDRLSDVQLDRVRQTSDLNQAEKAGLDGMPGVVSARRNVEDAERGVASAREALIEAQVSATRTEKEGAAAIAAAVRALADTRDEAAQRNADAATRVEDAERDLTEAMADATAKMGEQSTEAKKLKGELEKLGPAGREFVEFLDTLRPQMKELQDVARAGMLPGVEDGIRDLMIIFPDIVRLVDNTSQALGDLASRGGDALNDPFWQKYFKFLSDEAGPIMDGFGRILGGLATGFAGMQIAFNPMARDVIDGLGNMMDRFATWGESLETNTSFQKFVAYVRETAPIIMNTLRALGDALKALAIAAAPIGPVILKAIEGLANALAFIAGIPGVGTTLLAVAAAMGALNIAIRLIQIAVLSRIGAFLIALPGLAATAGTAIGLLALKAGASAGVATGVANAGRAVGTALSAVGKALPLIGVAAIGIAFLIDEFGSKAEENAAKVIDGSQTMREAIEAEQKQMERGVLFWFSEGQKKKDMADAANKVTEEYRKQYDALSPLEQAQADVAMAQERVNDAMERFGAGSLQHITELNNLSAETRELEIRQIMAAEGVDRHTAALLHQNDVLMAATNADISYERSLITLEQSQRRATDATNEFGAESLEARDANLTVRESAIRVAAAAGEVAAKNAEAAGETNTATIRADAQRDSYLELAKRVENPLRDELIKLAGDLVNLPKETVVNVRATGQVDPLQILGDQARNLGQGAPGGFQRAGHAAGGPIHGPGTGTSDSIPAMLSNGEYVLRAKASREVGASALNALNAGQATVVPRFAAGGLVGMPEEPFRSMTDRNHRAARDTQVEHAVAEMKRQQAEWYAMQFGGGSRYTGPIPNRGSVWGTLWALVQQRFPQARLTSSVRSSGGGYHPAGKAIDIAGPRPMDMPFMGAVNRWIAENWPNSTELIHTPGINLKNGRPMTYGADTRAGHYNHVHWAMENRAMLPGGAGGAAGATGPVADQVRAVANRYGWGGGPEWAALARLIQKESSWNMFAANPRSSARGLFQKMTSIHGPVEPTAAGQAVWGLNYIRGRYGSPSSALRFHNARNYYDDGGVASGRGLLPKNTIAPERVLSPRQTVAFERLVDVLARPRPVGVGGATTVINKHYHLTVQNAGNTAVDLEAQFTRIELMAGV